MPSDTTNKPKKIKLLMDVPVHAHNLVKGQVLEVLRVDPPEYKNRTKQAGVWILDNGEEVKILRHEYEYYN